MTDNSNIQIQSAESKHVPELIQFLKQNFLQREPLGHALGVTWAEAGKFFEDEMGEMIGQGLSFVAIDKSANNRLVGCRISLITDLSNTDISQSSKDQIGAEEPDFVPLPGDNPKILALLSIFRRLMNGWTRKFADCKRILDFVIVCVDEQYSGHGIAKQMIDRSLALAEREDLRIDYIFVAATNRRTQHIFEKLNFFTVRTVEYKECRDEKTGESLITEIHDGSTCAKWMAKKIRKD